jgi:hypothetical protein
VKLSFSSEADECSLASVTSGLLSVCFMSQVSAGGNESVQDVAEMLGDCNCSAAGHTACRVLTREGAVQGGGVDGWIEYEKRGLLTSI